MTFGPLLRFLILTAIPCWGIALGSTVDAQAIDIPLERHTLKNGLRVVLNPDRTAPTVAIVVYYDVGSRNEVKGRSGFAHLFEHMMFQGSKNVPKGAYFKLINQRGGTFNGTTSVDRTNYFSTLPSNELALGLWLEADRMRALNISQENFENQRQTVMEERRQSYDNQPYGNSMLRINELAYGDYYPYAHSTIGDMEDLKRAPLHAVQEFFKMYYAPNNAVICLSGDFDPRDALKLVRKYFEVIPSADTPAFSDTAYPKPLDVIHERKQALRESMVDKNAELPAFHMAYPIPPSRTPEHYPLELLAWILGNGESSRLYQKLVKQTELAREVSASTDDRRGPDLFSFWVVLSKESGRKYEQVRKLIDAEIAAIAKNGVNAQELERVKNRVRAALIFGVESNLSRAMQLGEFELYWGDAGLFVKEIEFYNRVTSDDIRQAAQKYLIEKNRTVLDVEPPPTAPAAKDTKSSGGKQ